MKVKMKRTGQLLAIHGPVPRKKGDRFEAAPVPPKGAAPTPARGCTTGTLPGGGAFIACSRGGRPTPNAPDAPKVYKFDPELHEVIR